MKSFWDLTTRERFSSSSSTKWGWTIRPRAASWASPKRPSAPQGTGFSHLKVWVWHAISRMGDARPQVTCYRRDARSRRKNLIYANNPWNICINQNICWTLQCERWNQVEPRCAERWHLRDDEQFDLAAWFHSHYNWPLGSQRVCGQSMFWCIFFVNIRHLRNPIKQHPDRVWTASLQGSNSIFAGAKDAVSNRLRTPEQPFAYAQTTLRVRPKAATMFLKGNRMWAAQ